MNKKTEGTEQKITKRNNEDSDFLHTLNKANELSNHFSFVSTTSQLSGTLASQGSSEEEIDMLYYALQIAKNNNHNNVYLSLLNQIGRAYYTRSNYIHALRAWMGALAESHEINCYSYILESQIGIAQVYDAINEHDTAIVMHISILKSARESGNPTLIAHSELSIGYSYLKLQKYSTALLHFKTAMAISEKTNHYNDIGDMFTAYQ